LRPRHWAIQYLTRNSTVAAKSFDRLRTVSGKCGASAQNLDAQYVDLYLTRSAGVRQAVRSPVREAGGGSALLDGCRRRVTDIRSEPRQSSSSGATAREVVVLVLQAGPPRHGGDLRHSNDFVLLDFVPDDRHLRIRTSNHDVWIAVMDIRNSKSAHFRWFGNLIDNRRTPNARHRDFDIVD